jgi:hypothetical protein
MRYIVQVFLPLYDNGGRRFHADAYIPLRQELTARFGGLTAYSRAPAEGLWQREGAVAFDDIIVFEVMTNDLDRIWWSQFRRRIEKEFRQDEIVVRAQQCELL